MDTKTLIKSLRSLFSNENGIEKKYTKVWMTPFYYNNRRYTVHVQFDNPIGRKTDEINKLENLINDKIEGALNRITSIHVHYFDDGYYHCDQEDIIVYDDLYDTA